MLVSALNPDRDSTGSSLVQVMLTLRTALDPRWRYPGLTFELLDIYTGGPCTTWRSSFRSGRAGSSVGSTTTATCSRPGRSPGWRATSGRSSKRRWPDPTGPSPSCRYSRMTSGARSSRRWNASSLSKSPRDTCVHQLVEEQVARTPECGRRLVRGTVPLLRRAERPGKPAGAPAAPAGGRARRARSASVWNDRSRWLWGSWPSSRRVAPTSRSTRTTRPSGWPSCFAIPRRRSC